MPNGRPGGQRPGGQKPGGQRPGGQRPGGRRPGGRRFMQRRRICRFCVNHVKVIDYKNADFLRRYISDRAKIEPRRKTGVCAKHQRVLSQAIKRARHIALLPFAPEHTRISQWRAPTTTPRESRGSI